MKRFIQSIIAIVVLIALSNLALAQLPYGTYAPNFTATDLNGDQHTLYDYLDEGKTVILFVTSVAQEDVNLSSLLFAMDITALLRFYSNHGPLGSKDAMVFMLEIDPTTTVDDIYGTGNNNWGFNYTQFVNYPIISNDSLGDLFPRIASITNYVICPNRDTTFVGWVSNPFFESIANQCPDASNLNDVILTDIILPVGQYCSESIRPVLEIYNPSAETITSMDIITIIDDLPAETSHWTGELNTYYHESIELNETVALADGEHTINFEVTNPNGAADEDDSNNSSNTDFSLYAAGDELIVRLETDEWPQETSWKIIKNDATVYESFDYNGKHEIYNELLCLDAGEWYTLTLYDSYADGMTAGGLGFLEMIYNDKRLFRIEGNEFTTEISVDFQVFYEVSSDNDFLEFFINGSTSADIDVINHEILVEMNSSDFLDNKYAEFTLSDSASAYINGVLQISGEIRNDFSEEVEYIVIAEDGTTQEWNVNTHVTAINNVNIQKIITYPNPAKDIIYLSNPLSGKFEIYNNIGELVLNNTKMNNQKSINVSALKSGLYHLKIIDGNNIYVSFLSKL